MNKFVPSQLTLVEPACLPKNTARRSVISKSCFARYHHYNECLCSIWLHQQTLRVRVSQLRRDYKFGELFWILTVLLNSVC